ncbi:gastrula zinc finger protein XlCGF53.1-like [Pyxicephalus adspersus]|uniref:gastrula zinc finger protein XlCGF53.1-like n=1 Tax=Pyxicephalus adspersus TaxID=30357 RepID=UPI003B5A1F7D
MDKATEIPVTDRILDLTLEIIYLLTGEDYTVVKKTSSRHMNSPHGSRRWNRKRNPTVKPPTRSPMPEKNNNKKILDVTNEITELLTGEVSGAGNSVALLWHVSEW